MVQASTSDPASIGAPDEELTPEEEPEELEDEDEPEELDDAPDDPDEDESEPEELEDVTEPDDDPDAVVSGPLTLPPHAPAAVMPIPTTTMA